MTYSEVFTKCFNFNNQEYLDILFNTSFYNVYLLDGNYDSLGMPSIEEKDAYICKQFTEAKTLDDYFSIIHDLPFKKLRRYMSKTMMDFIHNYVDTHYNYWVTKIDGITFLIGSEKKYTKSLSFLGKCIRAINEKIFGIYKDKYYKITSENKDRLLDNIYPVTSIKRTLNPNSYSSGINMATIIDGVTYFRSEKYHEIEVR